MPGRRPAIALGGAFIVAVLLAVSLPMSAQDDSAQVFATNTAPAQAVVPVFATNTPRPTPLPITTPDAPFERYALRLWDETALTTVLLAHVRQLQEGEPDRQAAIRLLQNELNRRFPGAPRDSTLREELLQAMLNAPRGSVDMRAVARASVEAGLNQLRPSFEIMDAVEYNGFTIDIMPANVDGADGLDAALRIRYPVGAFDLSEIIFDHYALARINASGMYEILSADYPAAPLGDTTSLRLERLGNLNGDLLAELAVSVERANDVNRELFIFGYRGGTAANLVVPGARLLYGELADWTPSGETIIAREYRLESPVWNCLGERDVTWAWSFNFFRPPETVDNFTFQNRLGCVFYGLEPLYEMPVDEAINTIESAVQLAADEDATSVQRAALYLAMLRVFNGQAGEALDQVRGLQATAEPGSWLEEQTGAFLTIAAEANITPIQVCAALQAASAYGACNVDHVLARLFAETPLRRDEPIEAQAARLGLTVLDRVTISAVGRRDREAVHFNLGGEDWWAFAPLSDDTYTAEKIPPPPGYEPLRPAPAPVIALPGTAVTAFLTNNDPTQALNVLDNATRDNPGVPLDSAARFLQALSYDLLGDRGNARQTYFDLWTSDPASVWGQMAAAHLERR